MADSADRIVAPVVVRCYSRWARWGLGAATALMMLVAALLISFFWADGWTTLTVVLSLILVVTTTLACLITAASIWNTVRVEVAAGDVVIERGPVPWRSRRVIPGETIEQVYVQQAPLERTFRPRLGGPFDVQARLRNGTWITIVAGCASEREARSVERTIERALKRPNEVGGVSDDERSEVFAGWRESLGSTPAWLSVEQRGDRVEIRYRNTISGMLLGVLSSAPVIGLAVYVLLTLPSGATLGAFIWLAILTVGLAQVWGSLMRRSTIVIDSDVVVRSANWPLWRRKPELVERSVVVSLDCRSRTVTRYRKHGARRYRRYQVVAVRKGGAHFRLTDELRTRDQALHIMGAISESLGREAVAIPASDATEHDGPETEAQLSDQLPG